jgi:UDP-N-acetylmuramoyl-L-alanyl-D-glutamate--2,6-diaminopimelate ligase
MRSSTFFRRFKPLCKGKLITVFGCGGDRDKTKRPRMAQAVSEYAERIFVTSDNPRSEKPMAIIEDILAGFANPHSEHITVEPDRRKAIEEAVAEAKHGDIILIAGKGHENYQIIGSENSIQRNETASELCILQRV